MLWDIIRDFFVTFIFGGITSNGDTFSGLIGNFTTLNFDYPDSPLGTSTTYLTIGDVVDGNADTTYTLISIGDWLSTTFTIITLCLICFFFLKLTIYLFKMGANLFKW